MQFSYIGNQSKKDVRLAGSFANGAFVTANSAASFANGAFSHANAAFNAANTGGSSTDSYARNTANAAFVTANLAYNTIFTSNNTAALYYITRNFTGDGNTNTFSISSNTSANSILVFDNGITQNPITDYSVSGNNIIFVDAPANGTIIQIRELLSNVPVVTDNSNSAFDRANAAYATANAAFNAANTGSSSTDAYARDTANAGFITANSAAGFANGAFDRANAAYNAANTATDSWVRTQANNAYDAANSSGSFANGAFLTANASYTAQNTTSSFANGAFDTANSAASFANGSFVTANAAATFANGAFDRANAGYNAANSAASFANSAFTTANLKFNSSGGTISGDVSITGNLSVLGNTFSTSATQIVANDTLFIMGTGNYSGDVLDIGFAAHYNNGTNAHTGLIRDSGTKEWQLFEEYTPEVGSNNNINIADASFKISTLNANVKSTTILIKNIDVLPYINNAYAAANSGASFANGAFDRANAAYAAANTGSGSYSTAAFTQANNAYDKANSAGSFANGAFTKANNALPLTGGTLTGILTVNANTTVNGLLIITGTGSSANAITFSDGTMQYTANTDPLARAQANSAYGAANSGASFANGAFDRANAAYNAANTATDSWVRTQANNAYDKANSAGSFANGAFTKANNALPLTGGTLTGDLTINANTTVNGTLLITGTGAGSNAITFADGTMQYTANTDPLARAQANNAYDKANSAAGFANGAFDRANAAYNAANNATDSWVRTQANNAYDKANSAGAFANGAFVTANSNSSFANGAFDRANASYGVANTGSSFANGAFLTANSAGSFANASFDRANAAYAAANTGSSSTDSYARNTANAAFTTANLAYSTIVTASNSAAIYYTSRNFTGDGNTNTFTISANTTANSILVFDNGITQNPVVDYGVSGNTLTFVEAPANGTIIQVRELISNVPVVTDNSNSAFDRANAAYAQANTAATDTWVRPQANSAYDKANSAGSFANGAFTTANSAADFANGAFDKANAGYGVANTGASFANGAFVTANSGASFANGAFNRANSSYDAANSSSSFANGAFTTANSSASFANASFDRANAAYAQANTGSTDAFARAQANAAFEAANTAGGGGGTLTGYVDVFTGDGSNSSFTLSTTPSDEKITFVAVQGVIQPKSSYSLSGNVLTFDSTPPNTAYIEITTLAATSIVSSSGSLIYRAYTGNNTATNYTITSGLNANNLIVAENGILQRPITDYTISGANVVFATAPATGVDIQIRELTSSSSSGGSGSSITWYIANANTTMVTSSGYFVDTTNGPKTMTLPTSATLGDTIRINDLAGTFTANNLTVARNGHNIQGSANDLLVDIDQSSFGLVYSNSTYGWKILEL